MLKRKWLTLFFSALFSISLITIWALGDEPISNFIQMAYFISFIAIPFLVLYGFPVSVLADKLTEGLLYSKRMVISFIIHLVFGVSFIIFYGLLFDPWTLLTDFSQYWEGNIEFFIAATLTSITSILFWIIDEILRLIVKERNQTN